eukprot:EG_transcript_5997
MFTHARAAKKRRLKFKRAFLTKAQAARKLGVSMIDFRRLCILKGIYPRHVKSIPDSVKKGGVKLNSQFYFSKDINWIGEDQILKKIFRFKTYQKRIKKFVGRGDVSKAKMYKESSKPNYSLVHCVKERYPTFIEAVREVDDAVSHVSLYAQLPAHLASDSTIEGHSYLTTALSKKSKDLMHRWNQYIVKSQSLRKGFISVKGYYFQAEIMGQTITWLVPHYYTTQMPGEVDYRVMVTFLEFYTVMLDFVLFRLEHDHALKAKAQKRPTEDEDEEAAKDANTEDFPMSPEEVAAQKALQECSTLFQGFKFFLGTEVPSEPITLIVLALGGKLTSNVDEADITHQVVDRPTVKDPVPNRDYVQPQWVVDCLNAKHLLPVDQYWPGKDLPAHLSPFEESLVTDHLGRAYEPDRLKELQRIADPTYRALAARLEAEEEDSDLAQDEDLDQSMSEAEEESLPDAERPTDGIVTDDEEDDDEADAGAAPAAPAKAAPAAKASAASKPAATDKAKVLQLAMERKEKRELMEKRMRSYMMSNKKRKLWNKIQFSQKRKDLAVANLADKRQMIAEGKLKVAPEGYLDDRPAGKRRRGGKGKKG